MKTKAIITSDSVGSQTSGVLRVDRDPKITPEAREKIKLGSGKRPKTKK